MSPSGKKIARLLGIAILTVLAGPMFLESSERIQIEITGGLSFLNPRDLNLFSAAEEKYNKRMFLDRLIGDQGYLWQNEYTGYFPNEFPRIRKAVPAGFRVKYLLTPSFSVSVSVEGFRRSEEVAFSGNLTVAPGWILSETKTYDPFRIGVSGLSVLGGLHYSMKVGWRTEVEAGLAAGWTWAAFDILSSWTYDIDLWDEYGERIHGSTNGHRLEGDGKGSGFAAKAMVRLNRALGKSWGFFVEAAASYSRIKSLSGGGRESSLTLPGATTWEGEWGIKKEVISRFWDDNFTVWVPTNYWEGWVAGQRDRDFILDLSAIGFGAGIYVRF